MSAPSNPSTVRLRTGEEWSEGHRVGGGRSLQTPPLILVEEEREDALTHRWVPGAMMTTGLQRQSVWPIKRI